MTAMGKTVLFIFLLVNCWCWRARAQGFQLTSVNGITHMYANNSIVTITDIGTYSATLLCTTTYSPCCTRYQNPETQWYFPNGSVVPNIPWLPYFRTRYVASGSVQLNRNPEGTMTGVFRCDIPDASGTTQSLYVGIYTSTTGGPRIQGDIQFQLTSEVDAATPVFTLTCTSTGGPATTVSWQRDGVVVPGGITDLTDPVNATYTSTLTVTGRETGSYSCVIANSRSTVISQMLLVQSTSPPTNVSAEPTSPTSIRISWTPPTTGASVVAYRIYYQAEGRQDNPTNLSHVDVIASTTQHTLSDLQGGIWYTITVVTKSQYLPSTVTGPVRVTLRASPPTDLSAEPASPTSIKVSWTPPVPLIAVTGYKINYKAEGGQDSPIQEGSVDVSANATHHILSDLQRRLWYTITVFAKSQSTVAGPVRVTLTIVRVKVVNATALLVSWDALRNTHHYTIYYSAFSPELFKVVDDMTIVVPSTRTYDIVVIRELAAGVEHQFQVTASLEVQGEMYESKKSILTKIVIDEAAFHLQMGPVSPCTTWSTEKSEEIRSYVHSGIAKAISYHCNCSFPVEFIRKGLFRCWKAPDEFTYRSAIVGTEAHNATNLVQFLQEWVNSEPAIQVDQFELWVDTHCPVPISSLKLKGEGRCS